MEFTILNVSTLIIIGVIIYLVISLLLYNKAELKKKKNEDTNIEWYGPDIYLKKKDYGEIIDDHREKIIKK